MNDIKCPKCGSNQITSEKKGFSGGKAVAGAVLTGGIGLLAGTIGSNKVVITCLKCGNHFKPGDDMDARNAKIRAQAEFIKSRTKGQKIFGGVIMGFFVFLFILILIKLFS